MKITRLELKDKYNIELPKGKYGINNDGTNYYIVQANGDSSGCIILGENKIKGKVIKSTPYEIDIVKRMKEAIAKGEDITIKIE